MTEEQIRDLVRREVANIMAGVGAALLVATNPDRTTPPDGEWVLTVAHNAGDADKTTCPSLDAAKAAAARLINGPGGESAQYTIKAPYGAMTAFSFYENRWSSWRCRHDKKLESCYTCLVARENYERRKSS